MCGLEDDDDDGSDDVDKRGDNDGEEEWDLAAADEPMPTLANAYRKSEATKDWSW